MIVSNVKLTDLCILMSMFDLEEYTRKRGTIGYSKLREIEVPLKKAGFKEVLLI